MAVPVVTNDVEDEHRRVYAEQLPHRIRSARVACARALEPRYQYGVTGVDRPRTCGLSRSGLWCVWFGVFAFGLGLMGRTFGQTASIGAVTGVTLAPSGPFSRV